jgi:hypothetical protein
MVFFFCILVSIIVIEIKILLIGKILDHFVEAKEDTAQDLKSLPVH